MQAVVVVSLVRSLLNRWSLELLNAGKPYPEQIKPFNFLLTSHVGAFGHPLGVGPEKFHLISPYESDPRKWLEKEWIDQHSGKRYRITTKGDYGTRHVARVKTYREVVTEYESHPETKCADSKRNPCDRKTVGLLRRRHVKIDLIKCIGKESNSMEEVDAGLERSDKERLYRALRSSKGRMANKNTARIA